MEQAAFTCLAVSTLCEPIFFSECRKFYRRHFIRNRLTRQPAIGVSPATVQDKTKNRKKKNVGFAATATDRGMTTSSDFGSVDPEALLLNPPTS